MILYPGLVGHPKLIPIFPHSLPVDTLLFRTVSVLEMVHCKRECQLEEHILELVYGGWRSHIYHIIDFQFWQIPFLEAVNLSLTFSWTYLDVFLMMISIGLESLFELFNHRLEVSRGKVKWTGVWKESPVVTLLEFLLLLLLVVQRMTYSFWIEIRTHYVILRNLVEFVDKQISILIAISFASNLYFICLQLFNSFIQ